MASPDQCGRGRGFNTNGSAEEANIQPPDLKKVLVLKKADWLRIADETNEVNKERERLREAAKQREELHLHSKEMVKKWSHTVLGQRKKKLEAKKVREQMEEEKRKQMDLEEANYREQKRKEAVKKAEMQLYYQTDRVKGLHSALLLTEVLKEREAQIELKQQTKSATKKVEKEILEKIKTREDEAMKQQEEKTLQKRHERRVFTEDLKNQIKENELTREQQELKEKQKDREEIQRLYELHQSQQRTAAERQVMHKRNIKKACMEHLEQRDHLRKIEAQKQKTEEEQRKLFLTAKQKMTKLRKEKDKEIIREAQDRREMILNKLVVTQQQQTLHEEQRTAKAAEELDARQALLHLEQQQKKAVMLKSITDHREIIRKEKEMRSKISEQKTLEETMSKMEADRIFAEMKQQEAKKKGEENEKLKQFIIAQMAEKQARDQHEMTEDRKYGEINAQLIAEEEKNFQEYSQQVIDAAAEKKKNVFPLNKAARRGIKAGDSSTFRGVQPTYLVQDETGTPMPRYVTCTTENIKKLHEAADIHEAKRRLGFTWS
ncbi:Coiled-coil domain-containing protein 173 [Oryzias melastigma]|uniref:Coiled-coil domain-containing protein 173 n=1 Tax=Oryzias melastigma TaxID=30732 RepID=A0A834CDP8_ORYME|nr:Coiled-coil domain-containing protein 173 [Oryzias melastigma]